MKKKINRNGRNQSGTLAAAEQRLGAVEYVPIASLKSDAANSLWHSERQLSQLMVSIRAFGTVIPILIDVGGTIVAGHARVEAARRVHVSKVPVLVATGWTEAQIRAYRAADHRLAQLGEWNEAQLAIALSELVQIDELPLEVFGAQAEAIDPITGGSAAPGSTQEAATTPKAPKAKKAPGSRTGDVWSLAFFLVRLSSGEFESPFGRNPPANFFATCVDSALRRWAATIGFQPVLPKSARAPTKSVAAGS